MEIQRALSQSSTIMGGKSFIVDWNGTYLAAENMQDVYDRRSLYDEPGSELSLVRRTFSSKSDQCGEIFLNDVSYQSYITYLNEYDWALFGQYEYKAEYKKASM